MLKEVHLLIRLLVFKEVNPIYQRPNHQCLDHRNSESTALTPILSAIRTQHLRWLV